MAKTPVNIVWLKRDLRTQDHAALFAAEQAGLPYLAICLLEPHLLAYPDTSLRHLQFIYHAVQDMNAVLAPAGQCVHLLYGEAPEVFSHLAEHFAIREVFSYCESGIPKTWERDKYLARWFREQGIRWSEFQRDGVLRGIRNREGWDKKWYAVMEAPLLANTYYTRQPPLPETALFQLPADLRSQLETYPAAFQPAGESAAWKYLHSFAEKRGFDYHRFISKPTESRLSCGRISPYLAWGNLSVRQAYQFLKKHPNRPAHRRAFDGILTRLKWRCHFIQKFEVECSYETTCVNRGYELLEYNNNEGWLEAWKSGKTGYPLVDACMRALLETGWLNFRMRAMLVSFLCHHLDQDWRNGVYHLAQLFLDYEPGIHYTQFQMQAGVTGVNTVRMYNPVKQSKEHDPDGRFIKKWVPELAAVPREFIHEPWQLTVMETTMLGLENLAYPLPLVHLDASGKAARTKIWGHRKHEQVKAEKLRILQTHTRNTGQT